MVIVLKRSMRVLYSTFKLYIAFDFIVLRNFENTALYELSMTCLFFKNVFSDFGNVCVSDIMILYLTNRHCTIFLTILNVRFCYLLP